MTLSRRRRRWLPRLFVLRDRAGGRHRRGRDGRAVCSTSAGSASGSARSPSGSSWRSTRRRTGRSRPRCSSRPGRRRSPTPGAHRHANARARRDGPADAGPDAHPDADATARGRRRRPADEAQGPLHHGARPRVVRGRRDADGARDSTAQAPLTNAFQHELADGSGSGRAGATARTAAGDPRRWSTRSRPTA